MKIVFHIPRMNWYRVLAPLIDEALGRGYLVECWHFASATNIGDNVPRRDTIPLFRNGTPVIVDYHDPADMIFLIKVRDPDVIVDIYPPRLQEIVEEKRRRNGRPFWLAVDLPPCDGILEIQHDFELYGCDMFAVSNKYYLECAVRYGSQDKKALLQNCISREKEIGKDFGQWVAKRFMYQYDADQVNYLEKRSIFAGNAGFDHYPDIDREKVRGKFAIPENKKVIVLLPFPFGYDISAPWEQLYAKSSLLHRIIWMIKTRRFDCLGRVFSAISDKAVVKSLHHFAEKNDALLIAKVRHSRVPPEDLKQYCHLLIGEEGYYPHTAAELFAVADLVVGHYSLGALEAVALGTPFLNIEIPGFPKSYYGDTRTTLGYSDPWPGVVWSISAREVIDELPGRSMAGFSIDPEARKEFLSKFASWPLGEASRTIFDHLEKRNVDTQ